MPASCPRHKMLGLALALALTFSLAAGAWPKRQRTAVRQTPAATDADTERRAREAYGKLGVSFEENRGQVDERVRFLSRRGGATVFLTNEEAAFVLTSVEAPATVSDERPDEEESARGRGRATRGKPKSHAVHMKFEGANPWAEVFGERELEGQVNYFRGSDPSKWQTNVRTYGAVRYRGIYEGIDLVYYGNALGQMEYDFEVAPGADAGQISLLVEGANSLVIDASGDLVISTPAGEMRQRRPAVYQEIEGARREVEGGYVAEPGGRVRFALGQYDKSAPLVIDPVLEYSTYLGGGNWDGAHGIAVDASRNAYVTGYTFGTDFPTKNPIQATNGGNTDVRDVFVTKFNASGSALVYSTYLGGSGDEYATDIAVDSAGNAYVAGTTHSTNYPTANAIQSSPGGEGDAVVTKLNAAGNALVYSTYLGGSDGEDAQDIAVDSAGSAYVAGDTDSTNFPIANALQATNGGLTDAFVTKFNEAGSAFVYSTYLGGGGSDAAYGIAADSAGNAYLTGSTTSTNFPTASPIQAATGGSTDAFALKLNAAGSTFAYSTYLGGSGMEAGYAVAVDSSGSAYLTGATTSSNLPTANAIQAAKASFTDAYVMKLNAEGSALVYSTYLGGNSTDAGRGIAVDPEGNAYVVGYTYSTTFPTANAVQPASGGPQDAFVTKYNAGGTAYLYSTYLGGGNSDEGNGIAADSRGSAYVAGDTDSTDFPVAFTYQGANAFGHDAFVTKISVQPSISGRVVSGVGAGVPNVTVKLTGTLAGSRVTDAQGYYGFFGLPQGGGYTVTPVKTGLTFVPASRTYANLNANINPANFTVPSLSVGNVTVTEGNTGELLAHFVVRLTPASPQTVTVKYQTAAGTVNPASAPADYTPLPLSPLQFNPGQTSKTVSVKVRGDLSDEPYETFRLLLSGQTNSLISDGEGVCTITDNDPVPSITVDNRTVTEPNTGTVNAVFTVKLSAASAQTVTVKYATGGGTAAAGTDYTARALNTLTFTPGQTSKAVSVQVKGDVADEPNETFHVNLSAATNASIADAQGLGTILDND